MAPGRNVIFYWLRARKEYLKTKLMTRQYQSKR